MGPYHFCFAMPYTSKPLHFPRRISTSAHSRTIRCAQPSFSRGAVPGQPGAPLNASLGGSPAVSSIGGTGHISGVGNNSGSRGGAGGDHTSGGEGDDGFENLREEVAAALREGRVSPSEVRRLIALESGPLGPLCNLLPGLRDRLVANPLFVTQLAVELFVGFVSKIAAEFSVRLDLFFDEIAHVISDLALEIVTDASLVWLLSPKARLSGPSGTGWLSGCPSHVSQIGQFSAAQRLTTFAWKGAQFAVIGFVSAAIGHGITRMLVAQRERRRAESGNQKTEMKDLGPVLPTALAWGGFLLCSSNARYQVVNGIEQRFIDPMLRHSPLLRTAVTFGLRFSNCLTGGVQWIPWAKFWGVQ